MTDWQGGDIPRSTKLTRKAVPQKRQAELFAPARCDDSVGMEAVAEFMGFRFVLILGLLILPRGGSTCLAVSQ
jgi:hypothetical protein